jgi:hypothetical protein
VLYQKGAAGWPPRPNSETTIVGAMEQLGGKAAKSVVQSNRAPLRWPKDIMEQPTGQWTDDYTGQLRYAKEGTFPYLGRITLQGRAGDPVGHR